jgi:hypothetical protein
MQQAAHIGLFDCTIIFAIINMDALRVAFSI